MKRTLLLLALLVLNVSAQDFDEKRFFNSLEKSYYTFTGTKVNNVTAFVTNIGFEAFADEQWQNKEIFPLQFIWLNSGRLFLTEQGTPALETQAAKDRRTQIISDMKSQITGLIWDLKRFYFEGIYNVIENDYELSYTDKTVEISFESTQQSDTTRFKYIFGLNGLLVKVESFTPSTGNIVETYPKFKVVKSKWLCEGWEIQMGRKGKIEAGLNVKVINTQISDYWVPYRIQIVVQQSEKAGTTFMDVIKFRNYIFDAALQVLDK